MEIVSNCILFVTFVSQTYPLMNKKIIALIIVVVTLAGPFQMAFLYNDTNSNAFNVLMFVLSVFGLLGAFVMASEAKKQTNH